MPFVQITILPQSAEKKAEMSKAITEAIHTIAGSPIDAISIGYYELPAENFASNGVMLTEKFRKG